MHGNDKRCWSSQRGGDAKSQGEIVYRSSPSGRYDEEIEGKRRSSDGYDQEERHDRVSERSPSSRCDESIRITRRSYESYGNYRDNHYDIKSRRSFDDTRYKSSDIKREHAEDNGYFNVDRSAYEG